MLPLSLLRAAAGSPMLVELKGGDTYNGRLVNCDAWMNLNLKDVICTSRDGDRFWKMPDCYIRGSSVKYLRLPEDAIDKVPKGSDNEQYRGGGGGGGRGRGGGGDAVADEEDETMAEEEAATMADEEAVVVELDEEDATMADEEVVLEEDVQVGGDEDAEPIRVY
eukprot:CAMPEP_0198289504 /NCGR_PEP_ID=MMETSP1449-20131203/7657_1 /TAXON_ID=420275 /ORGANISM="Attheya septentrionalis, Strain CCMP2084" /LENGTH=164 /DNA_ID=CAMNT_0043987839 /DNA_START=56 /DNA_END=551 /DNA_ORIENTATION=-